MTTRDYSIWLTFNAESERILLPVNPEKFQISDGSNNDTVNIVGLGEITVIQGRPELEFSFSSFFPAARYPGIRVSTITPPLQLVNTIMTWKRSGIPIHFICTGVGVSLYCTIEKFTPYEVGGDVGTWQYRITLKEYRTVAIRKITIGKKVAKVKKKGKARANNKKQPTTYTVKSGDCLITIAKKCGVSDWHTIYNANKSVIGGNPNLIYPGQKLTIPAS